MIHWSRPEWLSCLTWSTVDLHIRKVGGPAGVGWGGVGAHLS